MLAAIIALLYFEFAPRQVVFIYLHGTGIRYFFAAVFQYRFLNLIVETSVEISVKTRAEILALIRALLPPGN